MKNNYTLLSVISLLVVIILVSVLLAVFKPVPVVLKPIVLAEVTQLLTSLILVALFLERAMEVFITVLRGPEAKLLEAELRGAQREKIALNKTPQGTPGLEEKMANNLVRESTCQKNFTQYKSVTQRYALWAGFIAGLAISLVGVRTLNTLITPESYAALGAQQKNFFDAFDILISGGLIAGGSDGLHKILQVFLDFIDLTSSRINTPAAPPDK